MHLLDKVVCVVIGMVLIAFLGIRVFPLIS